MTALNVFVLKGYICTITVYNKLCMKKKKVNCRYGDQKRSISKPIKYKWTQVAYKFCFSQIISRKDSSCLQISAEK